MPHTDPVQVKYSGRDFDTLLDDLQFRLESRFGDDYTDFATSTMGIILLDIISYSMTQLSWYQDRRATEGFLETALKRASVSRLTRPLGYRMRPATSATVDLDVTPEEAQDFEWRVYEGFKFSGPENLTFEVLEETVWAAGESGTKTVLAREGESKQVVATSDGSSNQEVRLPGAAVDGKYVVEGSVRVFVDGSEWDELEFLEFEETDQFEVHYHEEPPLLRFGNGVAGNIPTSGAEIRVTYVVNSGKRGNVSSNSITSTAGPLIQRFTNVAITVTNPNGASGGTDPEGIEEAKVKAPNFFATRGVAVTQDDYEALALAFNDPQYGAVSSAYAFVARQFIADFVGNGYLSLAEQEIQEYIDAVAARVVVLQAAIDSITASTTLITTELDSLTTANSQLSADLTSILDNIVIVERSDQIDRTEDVLAKITGDTAGYGQNIDEIIATLDLIIAEAATAYGAEAQAARDALADDWKPDILLSKDTWLPTFQANSAAAAAAVRSAAEDGVVQSTAITTDIGQITTENDNVIAQTAIIQTETTGLETEVTQHEADIDAALANIRAHYDEILANDCKSNLITVPILTVDSNGFYVAPSIGLISRVQTYLQDRSDVAHQVKVVDGSTALIPVTVDVELTILESAVFSEVASDVDTEMRNLLKGRRFGVSLYLSTVYETIEAIDGIDTFDVQLQETLLAGLPAGVGLDSRGNIIADDEHIITVGSINIEQKLVT